ncbi:MAG: putative polymerase subfamily sigma factor [Frankiales bacterium]|nr:putative polymerase subfamily sigma factor [Frankiales bacterium]
MTGFDEQFAELHRAAYRVAYKLLGDRAEAQDMAQEALVRALVRWRTVEPYAVAWVSRVATNLALDRLRRHRPVLVDEVGRLDPDVAQRIDLQRALLALSRRQREVVVLRYLVDLPEADVAAALTMSTGSVKTHASRGLAALRAQLGEPLTSEA